MDWTTVLSNLSISGVVVLGSVFLIKRFFEHSFSAALEKYKSQLNIDLEKHKADLQRAAIQYQITYSKLHTDRAAVIVELNTKMVKMYWSLESFTLHQSGDVSVEKKAETAYTDIKDFEFYYKCNMIYFGKNICALIDSMLPKAYKAQTAAKISWESNVDRSNLDIRKEKAQAWKESWKIIEKELPKIQENLQEEFRELLDVGGPISSEGKN